MKRMKKWLALLLASASILALSACSDSGNTPSGGNEPSGDDEIVVGISLATATNNPHIANVANALKEAVRGSNLDDIKAKQEDLQKKFYDVSAKLYQNVNPQGGQPGPDMNQNNGGNDNGQNNDGFVDADFKEV